jgi:NAD(P)-dependent dehydrogenase (short-subunit alcohol dehydrogenase family)
MTETSAKNILITGVSSGLGEALARFYLSEGWHVYGLSRRAPGDFINNKDFSFAAVDLCESDSLIPALQELITCQSLDLVILNAGILGHFGDMADVSLQTLREVMDVNVWSNKLIIDCVVLNNISVKQVVAISSGASISGSRGWNGYGISKAALNMMIKLYAAEIAGTHFTSLAPGLVDSPMQDYLYTLEIDDVYPTLNRIKSTRNTEAMPKPDVAARNIAECIERLPTIVKSGDFIDIRNI